MKTRTLNLCFQCADKLKECFKLQENGDGGYGSAKCDECRKKQMVRSYLYGGVRRVGASA